MSKQDPKKDATHIEEVDLNAIVGTEGIFDLGKIREKATLTKDTTPAPAIRFDDEGHADELDVLANDTEEVMDDDLLPIKDKDLLFFEDNLPEFEDFEDEADEDIEE